MRTPESQVATDCGPVLSLPPLVANCQALPLGVAGGGGGVAGASVVQLWRRTRQVRGALGANFLAQGGVVFAVVDVSRCSEVLQVASNEAATARRQPRNSERCGRKVSLELHGLIASETESSAPVF